MTRVVVLTPYLYPVIGGVESNAERFARYLHGSGAHVQVVTKRVSSSLPDIDNRDGVPLFRIGPAGHRSASGKWLMSPAVFAWLVRHSADYDVVCIVDYRGVGIPAIAARALTKRPVLVQGQTTGVLSGEIAAGSAPEGLLTKALKWPLRAVYRQADAFACISRVLEKEALASGVSADRVHLLPNAIDMRRFSPADLNERAARRAALGLSGDDVACLYVGRLSREKGVVDLVEAWQLLQPTQATLLIAGPDMPGNRWDAGPMARMFVESHGLAGSVRFLGACDDVASLLQVADIVVQPSHFEALGLSAIEALACGVPVIASAVGGLLDFIADGRNGRLVPPQDPPALSLALREVITDSNLRARLAAAARASVSEYDERVVFARMADLLTTLAAASRR